MTVQERLARVAFFKVRPDLSSLSSSEKQAIVHCVNAARITTDIYRQQVHPDNPRIYRELKNRSDQEGMDLLKYFNLSGGPWDHFDHDVPFVPGVGPKPKFGSFYPLDMTKDEWNKWLADHPHDRDMFESNYTIIKRHPTIGLTAIPYSTAYAGHLYELYRELLRASDHLTNGPLKSFLQSRAHAFLSNDYFESELAWIDTDGNPFEVTIGPYEVYFDELLGLKASFETFVGLPDKDATNSLKKFIPYVPEFDLLLSKEFNFKPKGAAIPLQVMSDVIRGGDAASGYLFVAYNLPNDRRVHELKGSKKVFSRTMMQAKFDMLAMPIAERIFNTQDLEQCKFSGLFNFILCHELAHGLGPSFVNVDGRDVPFEVLLGDRHSCIEEAKADMLGARLLDHFRNRGVLNDDDVASAVISEVTTYARNWYLGFTEDHSLGTLMQYNWLKAARALEYNYGSGKFEIAPERIIRSMKKLSTELINLQIAGDYGHVVAFMKQWGEVPHELPLLVEKLKGIPKTVVPIYELDF